ncbi:hypothetical protein L6452_15933 [Arctium lappa]|uniref:Uncharacterized protein n=1 Tax=Arctium lappa TaxID=4217 RepID=A0ACB9CPZ9_ARCLA|nr:hypothetical protein L6452_15933 [Arctium lappa]
MDSGMDIDGVVQGVYEHKLTLFFSSKSLSSQSAMAFSVFSIAIAPKAAAEKKPAAVEKAPAEKKPKVEKKLPKDASVAGADKKEEEAQEIGGDLQDLHIQGLFFLVPRKEPGTKNWPKRAHTLKDERESKLQRTVEESKQRGAYLENELANMWVLVAKLKKAQVTSVFVHLRITGVGSNLGETNFGGGDGEKKEEGGDVGPSGGFARYGFVSFALKEEAESAISALNLMKNVVINLKAMRKTLEKKKKMLYLSLSQFLFMWLTRFW